MNSRQVTLEAVMQQLFQNYYLPLMSCTFVLTQQPDAAVCAVRGVFLNATEIPEANRTSEWLFTEMLSSGPYFVTLQGYNPSGFVTLGSKNNIADLPPGKRFPLELIPIQPNPAKPLLPGMRTTGLDTVERWILYPLTLTEGNSAEKREIKTKLLLWLSQLVNDAKIIAILGAWFDYRPNKPDAEAIMVKIASLIGHDLERAQQIWWTQHNLWNEVFGERGTTLFEAMAIWFECLPLTKEEQYQECLKYGMRR